MRILLLSALPPDVPGGVGTFLRTLRTGLESEGHRVENISMSVMGGAKSPRAILRYLRKVSAAAHALPQPVLHAHGTWQAASPILFEEALRRVFTFHTEPELSRARTREVLRLICSHASLVTTVSEYMKDKLVGAFPHVRVEVIPPAIPRYEGVDRRLARGRLGLADSEFVLAFATPLAYPQKVAGLRVLFQALGRGLRDSLVLVGGSGHLSPTVYEYAREVGLADRLRVISGRPDVSDLLAAADLYVHASLRDSLGIALLEAMAMGKPVVAFPVGGIPEAVEHGRTGLLVPPEPDALLAQLVALREDPDLAERLGRAAQDEVRSRFSWGRVSPLWARAYGG